MHVVIGQEGMQQGPAFNPSMLLLKTFLIFKAYSTNESFTTLHTITYKHTIQVIKKHYTNHNKQKQK
jgi:hypothetical protein